MQRGFSLIELLIAMAIGTIVMSAVFLAIFGDQSTVLSSETDAAATGVAQQQIEQAQALGKQDFGLVNTTATTSNGIYSTWVNVQLSPDFVTKTVTSYVSWIGENGQKLLTRVISVVTDVDNANSPNTCNSTLSGNWTNPIILNPSHGIDIDPDQITGVDVFGTTAYITGYHSGSKPDFFTVDVSDSTFPQSMQSIDTGPGLNAVAIASTTNKIYAFVANRSSVGQLQVIDATNPNAPVMVKTVKYAGSTGIGNTVAYHNKYLYLGLEADSGNPEFVIYDVSDPANPIEKGHASFGTHTVNAIFVKGSYAFVATAANTELSVLDVSDPNSPTPVGGGSGVLPDSTANGESVYVVGDTVYVGRAKGLGGSTKQFYIFNASTKTSNPLPTIGTPFAVGDSVNGLIIRTDLAFTTSNSKFQVWSIANPASVSQIGSIDISGFSGSPPGSLTCNNNLFYVGVTGPSGGSGHDVLKIIGPGGQIALANGGDISVVQGTSGNTSITTSLLSGTAAPITLAAPAGLPAGATYSYTNGTCTPTCTSKLTINTAFPTTPVGTYPITVTTGGVSTSFNLVVALQPFDYTMTTPTNVTVARGKQASSTLSITKTSGAATAVTMDVTGLPAGVSLTSVNSPCTPNTTCSPQLGIQTTAATPVGTYTVTVSGTPDGVSNATKTFTLTVTTPPFSYSLSGTPNPKTLTRPGSYPETVIVTNTAPGSVAVPVTVSLSGFQNNVSYAPATNTCTPNPTCSVVFTITAASNAQKVSRNIIINGSTPVSTAQFSLTIQ